MSEQFRPYSAEFDQNSLPEEHLESTERIHFLMLQLADVAIKLSRTYRVPRYDTVSRENDSEHSVMVALQAAAIAAEFRPDLNPYEAGFRAIVHELIEIIVQDVQTFTISDEDLVLKEKREDEAIETLCSTLPPFLADLVREYQRHDDPHSRFVGMIDKTAPVAVDILGPGSKFMHEDYETRSIDRLQEIHAQLQERYQRRYPDPELAQLHFAQRSLMLQFESTFIPIGKYYEGPEYII